MSLDPQARAFLKQLENKDGPPLDEMTPADARSALAANPTGTPEAVDRVHERSFAGPFGEVGMRVYRPAGRGPFPALVYFHGGGWVAGGLDSVEAACTMLANRIPALVVSVDYRLAPEHKFPTAVIECRAATQWVADHAAELEADARRIAVGGDSAGGNLAAVVAMLARDSASPPIVFQVLFYPATNNDFDTPSYRENGQDYYLTTDLVRWFWNHYLDDASSGDDARASPLRMADAGGLPPALIVTAEYDPLRDEGEAYAERLRAAGNAVTLSRYDGQIHSFVTRPGVMDAGVKAIDEAASHLRHAFGAAPPA